MNDQVFGVHCSNGFYEFDSHTTTKIINNMKFTYTHITENYTEITEYKIDKNNKVITNKIRQVLDNINVKQIK